MVKMKQLLLILSCSISIYFLNAQTYTASGYVGFNAVVNGEFTNTNMQSDGVDYYQHVTNTVFMFRVDLSGSKSWVIADAPNLSALQIYDVNSSASNTPPTAGWAAGFLVFGSLPVELVDFTVSIKNKYPELRWSTANEINNKGFEIESSEDGQAFKTIAFVEGQGDSEGRIDYQYIDPAIPQKTTYYRLKQVDFDHQFAYSEIISLFIENAKKPALLFPNPVSQNLNILNEQGNSYEIWDANGQLIDAAVLQETPIDVSYLNSGHYSIRIKRDKRLVKVLPFVKM